MVMATDLSDIEQPAGERIRDLIAAAGLPVLPPAIDAKKLRAAMEMDKKVRAKQLRFVLLKSIGEAYIGTDYSESLLNKVFQNAGL